MRYGFVIDQRRCIGCHACTVACKEENRVPLGAFRTWVKYVERGTFPQTRRYFSVLRCNHCDDAPCVTICPTVALYRRRRRHHRLRRRAMHRLQELHAGVSVRRALHRSGHAHRREVQLLRASHRGRARAGVRDRVPRAGDHRGRPGRPDVDDRPHRRPRAGAGAEGRAGNPAEGVLSRRRRLGALARAAGAREPLPLGRAAARGSRPGEDGRRGPAWRRFRCRRAEPARVRRAPPGEALGLEGRRVPVDQVDRRGRAARRGARRVFGVGEACSASPLQRSAFSSWRLRPRCSSSTSSAPTASPTSCSSRTGARGSSAAPGF